MTTTDPTPLAEQIAREHTSSPHASGLSCSCGTRFYGLPHAQDMYTAHIATVTERVVREQVEPFLAWLIALDDPDPESHGFHARRTVTLDDIIRRARIARGDAHA